MKNKMAKKNLLFSTISSDLLWWTSWYYWPTFDDVFLNGSVLAIGGDGWYILKILEGVCIVVP